MSRRTIFAICAVVVALFGGLVYYGWVYRWGAPSKISIEEPLVLAMPRLDRPLKLEPAAFDDGIWQEFPPLTVPLTHQVTSPPHSEHLVPEVWVRAYHDAKDAYFLLEWEDDVEGRAHDVGEFPDGIAVGFSLADEPPSESIMMGFQSLMNMWLWKANLDEKFWSTAGPPESNSPNVHYNYEEQADFSASTSEIKSACQELLAARAGSLTPKDETEVSGRGRWRDGKWRVVLKRALSTDDQEESVQFTPREIHIALAVWDGDKGDRGSRKSISEWIILRMGAAPNEVSAANQKEQPREIAILARRFKYEPGKITLKKGELVTFRLESADVTHGLYLDGYGIDIKARPGKVGKVTFRADKTGRFSFRCSETCGEFHPYMIGYLTVEPNSRFHLFVLGTLGASVVIALVASVERSKRKETAEDV